MYVRPNLPVHPTTSPFPRGTDSAFPKTASPVLQLLSTSVHKPLRRYSEYNSPLSLENKNFLYTKHTLTLVDHLGSLSHPGPRRLTSHPPPVQSPPSRCDSGLMWGSVSHPENLPLIPTDSAPASLNTHRHTHSQRQTQLSPHTAPHRSRGISPLVFPHDGPSPRRAAPTLRSHLFPSGRQPARARSTLTTLALGQE